MDIKSLELRHLRYFIAVAEALHFGRAAARLGISQPPLSQQVKRLEEIVGTRLFQRTRRRVSLTPAGEVLLRHAYQVLNQLTHAAELSLKVGLGQAGVLTVGFAGSTVYGTLSSVLRVFVQRYPAVELRLQELSTAAQIEAFRAGTLDVGFLREPGEERGVAVEFRLWESFVAALPARHKLSDRKSIHWSSLRDDNFVMFARSVAPRLHEHIIATCRGAGFIPRIAQEAIDWTTIMGLVRTGIGVSIAPASFRQLGWSGLRFIKLRPTVRTEIAVCRASGETPAAARAFLDLVRETLGPHKRDGSRC